MAATRWAALQSAAEQVGMGARRIGPFTPKVSQGGAAADGALNAGATAIVAHNDLLAIGVMQRLCAAAVRVPDDVSVVGFDDIFAADLCTPRLTTLGGAHADVGRAAVELLLTGRFARGRRPAARGAAHRAGAATLDRQRAHDQDPPELGGARALPLSGRRPHGLPPTGLPR